VSEAHGCEQLARSCYSVADWPGVELATFRSRANALTTEPTNHPGTEIWYSEFVKSSEMTEIQVRLTLTLTLPE